VQGDFDGDSRLDYAFWRPTTGVWFVYQSSTGQLITQQWGLVDDVPVPGDYDADGRTDFAVWRPSEGTWYVLPSSNPTAPLTVHGDCRAIFPYEASSPMSPGLTTSCGAPRMRPGTFCRAAVRQLSPCSGPAGDIPVPGTFTSANGLTDFASGAHPMGIGTSCRAMERPQTRFHLVFRVISRCRGIMTVMESRNYASGTSEQNLYIEPSTQPGTFYTQQVNSPTSILATRFNVGGLGAGVYVHVSGDFDGDGLPDFALWRPLDGTWFVAPSSNPAAPIIQPWGLPGDVPVPAVFARAGGPADFAVWRQQTVRGMSCQMADRHFRCVGADGRYSVVEITMAMAWPIRRLAANRR